MYRTIGLSSPRKRGIKGMTTSAEQDGDNLRWRTVLILGLGNAVDAIEILSIGYILAVYQGTDGSLTRTQQSVLAAAVFVGMLLGGLGFGLLSDRIGRRRSLLYSLLLNATFAFLTSVTPNVSALILCRMLEGIGIGGTIPAIFTLCTELVPPARQGFYVTIVAAHWMLGSVFTAGLAWALLGNPSMQVPWRMFAAIASAPAFVCWCLIFLYVPESNQFRMQHQPRTEVVSELHAFDTDTRNDDTEQATLLAPQESDAVGASKKKHEGTTIASTTSVVSSYRLLFDPTLRSTTISLLISWFCLSFGSYGIATWIPVLFERIDLSNPFANAFIYAAGNLPGNIYSALLMDKWGGRRMLFVSMVLAAASATGFACFTVDASDDPIPWSSTVAIIVCASAFNAFSTAGWNAIDLISAQSFPTEVRTTGMGLLTAGGRGGSIIAQIVNGFLVGPPPRVALLLSFTAIMMLVGSFASLFARKNKKSDLPISSVRSATAPKEESAERVAEAA